MAKWPSDPRERALALRAAGKLGRPEDAARGRRRRIENAHQRISEIGFRHIAKVEKALVAGLESASVAQRLKASELILRFWLESERHEVREQAEQAEAMDRDALIAILAAKLTSATPEAEIVRQRMQAETIDGHAGEIAAEGGEIRPAT
jgi:hypothetical protein